MELSLDILFAQMTQRKASDMALVPGAPPAIWVCGRMTPLGDVALTDEQIERAFLPGLTEVQRERLAQCGDVDYSVGKKGLGRLRINLHRQRGSYSAALRLIGHDIAAFEDLNLPPRLRDLADLPRGLVLVTGGAAAGKSTTLAAMIEYMNQRYAYHIITLEDPIEYAFRHGRSLIEQREIGLDSPSFASALRHVVRQRPDVVLIGEMRDLETISAALTAAETGQLVLATLHTNSAGQTVDRIIDIFPASQQTQVRVQMANCLQGIACQTLLRDQLNDSLIPAVELLVATPAIRRAIRDSETHLLTGMIEMGKTLGMQSMDMAIAELVKSGRVDAQDALACAQDAEKLRRLLAA
jgi:twitching motility protein PilT